MRIIDFADGYESETTPTIGNIVASALVQYPDDATYEATEQGAPTTGNLYYNTTLNLIRYYTGANWISLVDESSAQTVTNKSIDADNNTITNIDNDEIKAGAGIDVTKLHDGSVDNTEFGYLDGVTSSIQTQLDAKQELSEKGVANGYCPLDATAKVPAANLPSYVDDVEEYADQASFPATGEAGKIYVALDVDRHYRWTGTVYIDTGNKVDTVNGQDGVVSLGIDDLTDVDTSTTPPADGQSLVWNQTNSNWEPGVGVSTIDDLTDVDTSTTAPADGEVLTWNQTNMQWEPGVGGFNTAVDIPIVEGWQSYTPTLFNVGNGSFNVTGEYRRIGDTIDLKINGFKTGGAGSGAGNFGVSLPSGLSVDFTKWNPPNNNILDGAVTYDIEVTNQFHTAGINVPNANELRILNTGTGGVYTGSNLGPNSEFGISVTLPIVSWDVTSSTILTNGDPLPIDGLSDVDTSTTAPTVGDTLEYNGTNWVPKQKVYVEATTTSGQNVTPSASTVTYDTEISDSLNAYTGGVFTPPFNREYTISAAAQVATQAPGQQTTISVYKNGSFFRVLNTRRNNAGGNDDQIVAGSTTMQLLTTDTIEIRVAYGGGTTPLSTSAAFNYLTIKG